MRMHIVRWRVYGSEIEWDTYCKPTLQHDGHMGYGGALSVDSGVSEGS